MKNKHEMSLNIIMSIIIYWIIILGVLLGYQIYAAYITKNQVEQLDIDQEVVSIEEVNTENIKTEKSYIRFSLSDYERSVVESLVMAEAGGECYEGQMAVAQCILNACEKNNCQPSEAAIIYKYTKNRPKASDSVKKAVDAVFNNGETVTESKILYFYAPDRIYSSWHETQNYIMTIGGHRFFALKGE